MLFKTRVAEEEYEEAIRHLLLEKQRAVHDTEIAHGYEEGFLDKYWGDNENRIYVAEDDDYVHGYIAIDVCRHPQEYMYINDISVTESSRGNGIGTKLLELAENYARKLEIRNILLHVEKTNVSAYRLFEKVGFKFYKEQGHRYLMRKEVTGKALQYSFDDKR